MTKPRLEDAVALLDLPSWEHVGALLLSHGITDGEQCNSIRCPIAQFLETVCGRHVTVGGSIVWRRGFSLHNVSLPPVAVEFIAWFDDFGRV